MICIPSNWSFVLWIVAILCINIPMYEARRKHLCIPCHGPACEERRAELECLWGDVRDECNNYVCAKGPGEACHSISGGTQVCADGLMCNGETSVCHGCAPRYDRGMVSIECFRYP